MRSVAKQQATGTGSARPGATARLALLLACLGGGWCHAQQAEPDTLVLALSRVTERTATAARPHLSISRTDPVAGTAFTAAPGSDVGVSWRTPLGTRPVDITAWHRMAPPPDAIALIQQRDPTFGARVEMPLARPRAGFASELRFIGMQLDNGARIGVRKANGNPALYYRQQF